MWSLHYTKDNELLVRVQHRFIRMIKEARDKYYLDRLKKLNLWTLKDRRNRADLTELFIVFKTYKGYTFESIFTLDCNNKSTRGHLAKMSKPRRC